MQDSAGNAFQRGWAEYEARRYQRAIDHFTNAIALNSQDTPAFFYRADSYRILGQYGHAIADFTEVINRGEKYEKYVLAWYGRGEANRMSRRFNDALRDLKKALSLDKKNALAWTGLGHTYRLMGNYVDALKAFEQALKFNPNYAFAWYGQADTYRLDKNYKKALLSFNKALELDDTNSEAWRCRGETYKALGRQEKAEIDFEMSEAIASKAIIVEQRDKVRLPTDPILPEHIECREKIGGGAVGDIFRGRLVSHPVDIAIKKLKYMELTKEGTSEFLHEIKIMAKLSHPHIIKFLGACTTPGNLCILMELMPKGSLYHVLRDPNEKLDWSKHFDFMLGVGRGLSYLHSKGILHRDLKSANVLVGHDYQVKVCDFGLAGVKNEVQTHTTRTVASAAGTLAWMAPEILEGGEPSVASDVHSFGMTLFEILTHLTPFLNQNPGVMMALILQGKRPAFREDTPPDLKGYVERCWAQDPASRPPVSEVVKWLEGSLAFFQSIPPQPSAPPPTDPNVLQHLLQHLNTYRGPK